MQKLDAMKNANEPQNTRFCLLTKKTTTETREEKDQQEQHQQQQQQEQQQYETTILMSADLFFFVFLTTHHSPTRRTVSALTPSFPGNTLSLTLLAPVVGRQREDKQREQTQR